MRIRKHVRKISVGFPPGDSLVYSIDRGCDRDMDCEKSSQTNSAGATSMEESWVDFLTTSRRHSFPAVERPVVKSHGVEDLSPSKDQVERSSEGEHLTRHYVRRSVRKDADGAALVQSEFPIANVNAVTPPNDCKSDDVDASKQCEPSEVVHGTMRAEQFASAGNLCKLPETEPFHNKENQDHPSEEPEGSLLHSLYLQLLAAGKEGLTLRELFTSFKIQASLPSLASDWKDQVRLHLKRNPSFGELKGRYFLSEELEQLKRRSSSKLAKSRIAGRKSSVKADPQLFKSAATPTAVNSTYISEDVQEGMQTRRKAYQKTIEAVLSQSALEFQKLQKDLGTKVITEFRASNFVATDPIDSPVEHTTLQMSKKRKSLSDNEEETFKNIRGSLKAMQARIVAETGVRKGVPCARKDDARKWRCPLMAMEDHTLCEHHKILQERKKAKKKQEKKSRRSGGKIAKGKTSVLANGTKSDVQSPVVAGSGSCQTEETVVAGLGNGHAVQAFIDFSSHVPEGEYHGVQTRRKSLQINEAEAVMDFEKLQGDVGINQVEASEPTNNTISKTTEIAVASALNEVSKITKTSSDDERELNNNVQYERAVPGSLKALQAKIVAESGQQIGVRCARKDGSSDSARKWQCPLMAVEGHTLCEHHNFLKERKKARYAEAKRQSEIKARRKRAREMKGKLIHSLAKSQPQSNEAQHFLQAGSVKCKTEKHERDGELEESLRNALKDSRNHVSNGKNQSETDTDDDQSEGKEKTKDEDSNSAKLLPQLFKNAPKRRYVAAKKTAANVEPMKEKSQERECSPLIRPPTIPPLPALYGIRRKAVKNRSLLSL